MSDVLFIHHDDTVFTGSHSVTFHAQPYIDDYISKSILSKIEQNSYKAIFIKDSLSQNYLDLYGLRVAHHIRLTPSLGKSRELPIVIISDIDSHYLNKLSKLSLILFTQNIKIIPNRKRDIKRAMENIQKGTFEIEKLLDTIEVEKPEQSSNHDIANEWAIYRWAKFLDISCDAIENNNKKIENSLYFKYLREKFAILKEDSKFEIKPIDKRGKVLYIDDEHDKGWSDIIKRLLSKSNDISFECYKGSYENKILLLNSINNEITKKDPDVIILDMRLTPTDHKEKEIENLSGIKIAKKAKEINPGIQVIMITASAKSKSLEKLYDYGVLGYVQKENPYQIQLTTIEDINRLFNLMDKAFEKKYLKEVWEIQKEILGLGIFEKEFYELKNIVRMIFDILNSNIPDKEVFAGLTIFKSLEKIINFYIREGRYDKKKNKSPLYWKDNGDEITIRYNTVTEKIKTICEYRLEIDPNTISDELNKIVCFRNYNSHAGEIKHHCKDILVKIPDEENLTTWFKMLQKIITKMDKIYETKYKDIK